MGNENKDEVVKGNLYDILNIFNEAQKDYLCLRIKGLDEEGALKGAKRKKETLEFWRKNDQKFKEEERYLIDNRILYSKDAGEYFSGYLFSITFGLLKVANKISEWEELKTTEKNEVFRACKLLSELQKSAPAENTKNKSYDDRVLESHRKLKEAK